MVKGDLKFFASWFVFSLLLLLDGGCRDHHSIYRIDLVRPLPKDRASLARERGLLMIAEGCSGDEKKEGSAEPEPYRSPSSAPVSGSTTGSHRVSGGPFPSQPLNFPSGVNQGPGWKVPQGRYRTLPRPPHESSTQKIP